MSRSSKAREKSEKISQSKSSVYSHNSPKISTVYGNSNKPVKQKQNRRQGNKSDVVRESSKDMSERFRKELVSKATVAELKFKQFLDRNMINYKFQKVVYVSVDCKQKFYIADFFFKQYNLIVEIDGGYHYTGEQKIKDDLRSMHLRRAGYFVLRFDNSRTDDCKLLYSEILAFIQEKFGDL
jgi:very-short-patch-repair endonuclease